MTKWTVEKKTRAKRGTPWAVVVHIARGNRRFALSCSRELADSPEQLREAIEEALAKVH